MAKQILVMHGGNVFNTYEDFLARLKTKEVTLERLRDNGWKKALSKELGPGYDVLLPRMPNGENAKYSEWKIWFERMIPVLDDEIICIGHSLGGLFFIKYLSENTYPKKIQALLFVAAPHDGREKKHVVSHNFTIGDDLGGVARQAGNMFFFHSTDDTVVLFSDFELYKTKLPMAHFVPFTDRGHFSLNTFPEIVEIIKKVATEARTDITS